LHKRLALPFSVLCFSLLGLALGITTKKGGRASGFVLSLVLVLLFYNLFMNGQRLASVGKLPPWLGAWGGNIVLTALGIVLLATAERSAWVETWIAGWTWRKRTPEGAAPPGSEAAAARPTGIEEVASGAARLRFPKILDLYVSRGFCVYFLWSTLVCTVLFVVLTLFDLLDDIIRNRIGIGYVVDYFVFLTPQILQLVVPMSILLAILINFGILEKSSEVTALKAGGWSLYRIAVPVFILAGGLCMSLYLLGDYVLPYANIRQDSLRHIIKGRPAQTSLRPQRKWIFGESNRIFNYDYFDAGQHMFVGLNVIEIDLERQEIVRRLHAARAWVGDQGVWTLENGWVRDFRPASAGFQPVRRASFVLPEKAAYFEGEIFEPRESSKLTYPQLRDYIDYLRRSGYTATQLEVELYKKISFPVSCVVMALVGVPFSFSMGRRGAFYGITLSIVVAMSYWGIFSLFEAMGAYGLLVPLLAAWAPNLLFGATGMLLLLTIRT
jgi:LPS export ABC transporter permease LptG